MTQSVGKSMNENQECCMCDIWNVCYNARFVTAPLRNKSDDVLMISKAFIMSH